MASLIGSNGKFGTSMDCSQRLEILRKLKGANIMKQVNPNNRSTIKPYFNQDKHLRESGNGSSDYYNLGLQSLRGSLNTNVKRYGF